MTDPQLRLKIGEAARLLVNRGATEVYLFGSVTTGQLRDDSDVDLAVTGLPPGVFFRAMAEASRIIGRPVDLLDLDHETEIAKALHRSGDLERVA